ncbi:MULTISPECIES: polysaccharide deacetylase family protein [Thermomonospora]|uniref:Polysaccharide deacetylase n=1 Tax=Thermomonospora curvata (strain ATCC 19995 / DSM 43183 / JCM 3096 / KCTC 9072 / NBRC 15933 / NCIMB 10081 / Henssen B9) TaxID=471852 RepID=D1A7Y7_THECD|nr:MULTISPECIES: polysaccharide deacetylase family protein [Thermomonospora]ACY98509.1 polysaccharide deacetylase [Thermomonospora curvata DSM 43183]PKK13887.1 MAG: polysaccharide deacetylase family protein [Thermomonospora sp. CIF 1]
MRGKTPLVACLVAGVLGVGAGIWPEVRTHAAANTDPSMRGELSAMLADQQWQRPKPGSWTIEQAADIPRGPVPTIRRINTQDKVVFLTIDDGYEYDAEFVRLVREHRVPILTFLTSSYIKGQGQYFWAMRNAGSRMENHSVTHPALNTLPLERQRKEICDASDAIARQYGRRPTFLRPPFGAMNALTQQAAKECGIKLIMLWNVEFYNGTTGPGVGFNGFARGDGGGKHFRPGDIVLMHYRKGLAGHLKMILTWIREQGFRPAAVENYIPRSLGGNAPDSATQVK